MRPKALLAFTSLAFLFDTALTHPKSKGSTKGPDDEPTSFNPKLPDGLSGDPGQNTCPTQAFDPSGLMCQGNSGSSILSLLLYFYPSSVLLSPLSDEAHSALLNHSSKAVILTKAYSFRLQTLLFPILCLCELDSSHGDWTVAHIHLQLCEESA